MAGAIGIVFGLCVLSFTLGAALMYVVLRRREDAAGVSSPSSADEPVERMWVEKPAAVEPVDEDYDSRPIHRNPVMGLPQLEPALAVLAEPVPEPEVVKGEAGPEPEQEPVAEAEPEPVEDAVEEPETVEPEAAEPEAVEPEVAEPVVAEPVVAEPVVAEPVVAEPVVAAALPPPAAPQPVEHTTWVEREDFRQRYLRTFEEVRRKAGSN